MQSIDKNIQWYTSEFEAFEKNLNGDKSTSVHAIRRNAIRRLAEIGFPTTRQEEWRFTNISPITKIEFQPVLHYELNGITKKDIQPYLVDKAVQLVFINGIFSMELSDAGVVPIGMLVGSLAEKLKKHQGIIQSNIAHLVKGEENAFTALNTAFLWDGACISVPQGFVLDRPIQLLFFATHREQPFAAQPRNLIVAGANSQFKVVETYIGLAQNTYLTNSVTEMVLGENASS